MTNGKPAMLYFYSRPIDPIRLILSNIKKLKAFKDATYKKTLTGSFSSAEN